MGRRWYLGEEDGVLGRARGDGDGGEAKQGDEERVEMHGVCSWALLGLLSVGLGCMEGSADMLLICCGVG